MKGIPVRSNGDPVSRTLVFAGDYQQFSNWCMYSRVNRNSKLVKYVSSAWDMRGYRDFDLVFTGHWGWRREMTVLHQELHYQRLTGGIKQEYDQYESCEIEPNVVEDAETELARAVQICAEQGVECPEPGNHVRLPDGSVGPHAWVIQAIKDAQRATD